MSFLQKLYHLQLTTFITTECTPDLVIDVFSFAFVCIIYLVKYNAFLLKIQNVSWIFNVLIVLKLFLINELLYAKLDKILQGEITKNSLLWQMRYLLEQLQQICNELKSEKEIAIIKSYACSVKRYTVILLGKKLVIILLLSKKSC